MPSSPVFLFLIHSEATVSSPPTMASRERYRRTNKTANSNAFCPGSRKYSPLRIREIVGSDRPTILESALFLIPNRSAARSVALVITLDSLGADLGRGPGRTRHSPSYQQHRYNTDFFLWKGVLCFAEI